ncbi:hypothetical protein KAX02_13540 [candidate division WOR-3 bacterium]|nr:hypothetical protein [candidate division WOR-3 bacterium]
MRNELNLDITHEISKIEGQIKRTKVRLQGLHGELRGLHRVIQLLQDETERKREEERQIDEL